MEAWANGVFTGGSIEATAQLNAEALGRVGVISDILDLSPEQFLGRRA